MALEPKLLDPVQSLIDYTLEVKPYHTKIMEVLVEYIHTDYIKATIDDSIEFCFNLGYPDLNTLFDYSIVAIASNTVSVMGDVRHLINIGQRFQIAFSLSNDGFYYVTDISYDDISNQTSIQVRGSFPSALVSGRVVNSVIDHCGMGGGMLSTNVHDLSGIECLGGYGNFYDSFLELVIHIDLLNNELVLIGDHRVKFNGTHNVSLIDIGIDSTVANLTIVTDPGFDVFGDPTLVNRITFDGVNTHIPVVNDISAFPAFNPASTFEVLIQYIGYDDPFYCTTGDTNGETLFVNMKEEFSLDMSMTQSDDIHTYNWENTAQSGWDTVDFGMIDSFTEPLLPEQATPPLTPLIFDLWYDTVNNLMKQWRGYSWVSITAMYWYQEEVGNDQNVIYHKRIKNSLVDTGWLVFDPKFNDLISKPYDEGGYSSEPYNIFHDNYNIDIHAGRNSITFFGGDYRSQLVSNNTVTGYNNTGITQSSIRHATYSLAGIDASNRLKVLGDKTVFFVAGVTFGIVSTVLKHIDYNVVSSTFDGTYTLVTVFEDLVDINNNVLDDTSIVQGTIPAVFYAQPNAFEYDQTTATLYVSSAPLVSDIEIVDYYWRGPYALNITTHNSEGINVTIDDVPADMAEGIIPPSDLTATTFTEELLFGWGDVDEWFQYIILEVPDLNTFIVAGNAVADIQVSLEIQILGFVDNAGYYTVDTVAFNGLNTVITVTTPLPTNTIGGFVESATILPIRLLFADELSVGVGEEPYVALVDAGDLIDSLDYKYFDVGGFDETLETIHLNDK